MKTPTSTQGVMIPRHELWRKHYRAHRYAQHLTRLELNKRIRDIVLNMLAVTPEAKIGLLPPDGGGAEWMEKWTHVLEEMAIRHGPYPNGFDRDILHSEPFPDYASDLSTKGAKLLSERGLRRGQVFIKYGKRDFMEGLIERGSLRLQPASFFSRPGLNQAIRDDEMSVPLSFILTREQIVHLVKNPDDVPEDAPEQRLDFSFQSTTDFWLYCVTESIDPRLFVDFEAKSCVIVRNRAEFSRRLLKAAAPHTGKVDVHQARANYVDPLLPKSPKIFTPLAKPFGYSYQSEYRFCWLPKPPRARVEYIDLELGPLHDIAELVAV